MDKIRFMRLWDLYSGLLTPTQQEITGLYFNFDLTVSEIAEQKGISRQGVSECLALCKKQLGEYEQKLGHGKMLSEGEVRVSLLKADVESWGKEFLRLHPEYVGDIQSLSGVLSRDYASKAAAELERRKENQDN